MIPKNQSLKTFPFNPGSAVVAFGITDHPERLMTYFEGNVYEWDNLNSFEDMAVSAYGRLVTSYPTVARSIVDANDYVAVGSVTFDGIEKHDSAEFIEWTNRKPGMTIMSDHIAARAMRPLNSSNFIRNQNLLSSRN